MSNYDASTIRVLREIDAPIICIGENDLRDMVLDIDGRHCRKTILELCIDIILGRQDDACNLIFDKSKKTKNLSFDLTKIYPLASSLKPCQEETNECSLSWTKLLRETRKLAREPPPFVSICRPAYKR